MAAKLTVEYSIRSGEDKKHSVRVKSGPAHINNVIDGQMEPTDIDPLGDLYFRREGLRALGDPNRVKVTIEVID